MAGEQSASPSRYENGAGGLTAGRIVHYVAPWGAIRPAIVIDNESQHIADLNVFYTDAIDQHRLTSFGFERGACVSHLGVRYDAGEGGSYLTGSWHWPPRA